MVWVAGVNSRNQSLALRSTIRVPTASPGKEAIQPRRAIYIFIFIIYIYICIFILLLWYSVAQNHKDGLSGSSSMMVVYMDHKAWVEFGVSLGFRV